MSATRGLFQVTRLPQGMKYSGAIFQQAIEEVLKVLGGCVAYQGDVILIGATETELRGNRDRTP